MAMTNGSDNGSGSGTSTTNLHDRNHHQRTPPDEETSLLQPTSMIHTVPAPASSVSSPSSWIRLILFFVASVIAGGIIPGQNEYNRLFCEAGAFRYACHDDDTASNTLDAAPIDMNSALDTTGTNRDVFSSATCCPAQWLLIANVMNTLTMLVTFLFLLGGIMFDILGGKSCATLGCVILSTGMAILASLLRTLMSHNNHIPASLETFIFAVGVLTCDVGSFFINVGFYGFLFHLPTNQALILSLSNSCMSCASFLPIVLGNFMDVIGITLPMALIIYGIIVLLVSGVICWGTVPSLAEYHSNALVVLGLPIPKRTVKGLEGIKKQVRGAVKVLTHPDHWRFHRISFLIMITGWVPAFIYMSMADPLGQEIFQNDDQGGGKGQAAFSLGVSFLKVNTMIGLLVGPACGMLVDGFQHPSDGLIEVCTLMAICLGVVTLLCGVANWLIQIVVLICICISQTIMLLFTTRYAVVFAYPNRVGTVSGAIIAFFGLGSLVLILTVSFCIAITGSYIVPARITSALGTITWAGYIVYCKREEPFPSTPVLLPEDEREIAKNFGVSTIEDAAYVADMSQEALLKLSASNKVADQRRLSDIALSGSACERILHIARRRSSQMSSKDVGRRLSSQISLEEEFPVPGFAMERVRKGSGDTSFDCITTAFNGHGGFGGKCEPSIDWMFSSMSKNRDDPRRIKAIGSFLGPLLYVTEAYGIILELVVNDEKGGKYAGATCGCYPPGTLESDGSTMKTGGERFHYGLATCNIEPVFMNKEVTGEAFVQRLAAFKQDSEWDQRRKDFGRCWYVGCLGTHPSFQGCGYGKLLLDVVYHYAQKTKNDCYLECSGPNIAFYERCGYKVLWKSDICIHGDSMTLAGMVRKYQPS